MSRSKNDRKDPLFQLSYTGVGNISPIDVRTRHPRQGSNLRPDPHSMANRRNKGLGRDAGVRKTSKVFFLLSLPPPFQPTNNRDATRHIPRWALRRNHLRRYVPSPIRIRFPPPTHARPHHRPGDVYVNGRRVGYFSGDDIYCDGQREGYFSGTVRRSHRPRPCPSRRTSPTTLLRTGPLSREPRRLLERLRGHHRHLRRRLPAGTLCPSQARERGKKWGFFSSRR